LRRNTAPLGRARDAGRRRASRGWRERRGKKTMALCNRRFLSGALVAATTGAIALAATPVQSADWSVTEVQFQYGKLKNPFGEGKSWTPIVTLQHASGWKFGDVFFFVDFIDDDLADGFNDKDAYGEFYANFSSAKIFGIDYGNGLLKDAGFMVSTDFDADVGYFSWVIGGYLDWNVPGFAFLRTYVAGVIDDSDIAQEDGWQADISWAYPFQISGQRFSFEGHAEYTGNSANIYGKQYDWILAQPQLRWDAGYAFGGDKDRFFIGTEYQYWRNKLGTNVDESAFQFLGVWRF
jgi:hypothetical protein